MTVQGRSSTWHLGETTSLSSHYTDRSGSVIIDDIIRREEQVDALDVGLAELVLTVGWYIWWERRQFVHGEII